MSSWSEINLRMIIKFIGILLMIVTPFMAVSAIWSVLYDEHHALRAILISSGITFFVGFIAVMFTRKHDHKNIGKKEGYIIVALTWVCTSIFGALPFYFYGVFPTYTDAFFETMSGFTTTGASVMQDIEAVSKGILFWRSITQWLGGMGIIVLTLAILPLLGIGGMRLFIAEAPETTTQRLHPRITETAKRLWGIYAVFTLAQTLLLMSGGLSFFDALNHAFTTMSSGGFSTFNDSVAGFSAFNQYIVIFFMILAGINYSLHYYAIKGQFQKIKSNEEIRMYLLLIAGATILIALALFFGGEARFESSFRDSLFQVVSIITTTGFVSANYLAWAEPLWVLLFLLMFAGGCIGSTAGGIKIVRHLILIKNIRLEFRRLVHPLAVVPIKLNGKALPLDIIYNFLAFFIIYVLAIIVGLMALVAMGVDFESSLGAVVTSIGNVGPGIGSVGPVDNFAHIPLAGKWVLSFLMLIGRLELFTILILLSPSFYRN
ncbi:MAG TPA: potassium transporter [Bacteroidales bacterium]|nr:potassium transporter [Bacteroidales bacterium]